MFEQLFAVYMQSLESENRKSDIYREFLAGMAGEYSRETPTAGVVRDFIAGMTDEYFLDQCHRNLVPQTRSIRF